MRKQRRTSLQDTCQVWAAVEADTDDETNTVQTWPAISSTVACTVLRKSTSAGGESMELSSDDQWEVVVMDDVTITVPAQIIPTTGRYASRTFQSYDITRPGSFDLTNRVRCTEVVG